MMTKPALHVSIDWWRQDIPKTYAEYADDVVLHIWQFKFDCSFIRRVQIWQSCGKSWRPCPPGSSVLSAFISKASISDGMGVHKCIRYEQLACFGRHYECWKVNVSGFEYKGFRATYAPLQMTYISGKALCISAGQCKTTYCSYYNSMVS